MSEGYVRHVVSTGIQPEALFRDFIANQNGGFWLDDSLGETVSYMGVGIPITATGLTDFDCDSDFPVARVGWVSYGHRESTLGVSVGIERHARAMILQVSVAVEIDHRDGTVSVIAREDGPHVEEWLARITASALGEAAIPPEPPTRSALWRDSAADYRTAIEECLRRIRDGDVYQLCLTTNIEVPGNINPVDTYLGLRRAAPTRFGGYVSAGGVTLLSASPESFLTIRQGIASTSPIKGTRPRSRDPAEDLLLKRELVDSDKERAENLMIVDLCRNDLSRVCEDGSIVVPSLHSVETYSTVHQLVSTVSGTVRAGVTPGKVAEALFPAGSMTGTPKIRAVEILGSLESGERGIYSGVFGYAGAGDLSLAMTIRAIVIDGEGATVGVGGGITAGSDADAEIAEVGVKADALLRVLGASPNLYLSAE